MADTTGIEWCDSTFNPWMGCTRVSPACDDCYAARSTPARTMGVVWGPGKPRRRTSAANWKQPEQWQRQAAEFYAVHGRRRRVFCASLADVFDNEIENDWRCDLLELIESTPSLDWLLLTKRIGNVQHQVWPRWMQAGFPANVWIGATVVNQGEADRDIPKLLTLPARVRFLSIEPMLGAIDLKPFSGPICDRGSAPGPGGYGGVTCPRCDGLRTQGGCPGVDWVIWGGESGPKARPMHPDWARGLRDQCAEAGVPFLFKQWGEWGDPDSIERTGLARNGWFEQDREDGGAPRHDWPGPMQNGIELASQRPEVFRVGKKAAGRLLDGRTHDGFPNA